MKQLEFQEMYNDGYYKGRPTVIEPVYKPYVRVKKVNKEVTPKPNLDIDLDNMKGFK